MKQIHPYFLIIGLTVAAFGIGIVSTVGFDFNQLRQTTGVKSAFAAGSKEAFDYLSTTKSSTSSFCGLQPQTVDGFSDEESIQGACCGAMDFHRYQEQVEGLKKYKDISQIPEDPYNIPVVLAKELFEYQQAITLDEEQQVIYEKAVEISREGGPCCCKCWRWHAFEGQAKFLIAEHDWGAEEIASLWDIQDGCGGPGHAGEGGSH